MATFNYQGQVIDQKSNKIIQNVTVTLFLKKGIRNVPIKSVKVSRDGFFRISIYDEFIAAGTKAYFEVKDQRGKILPNNVILGLKDSADFIPIKIPVFLPVQEEKPEENFILELKVESEAALEWTSLLADCNELIGQNTHRISAVKLSPKGVATFQFISKDLKKQGGNPDIYFRVYSENKILYDGKEKGEIFTNQAPGRRDYSIKVFEENKPVKPKKPSSGTKVIKGIALISPEWDTEILLEAYSDEGLTDLIGNSLTEKNGRFEIYHDREDIQVVWFRWLRGKKEGRSPLLQPYLISEPIRLPVYQPLYTVSHGPNQYQAKVTSSSGASAEGMLVMLLEVSLRKSKVLGAGYSSKNGTVSIAYDLKATMQQKSDMLLVVFDSEHIPLLESFSSQITVPGLYAKTSPNVESVIKVFRDQGLNEIVDKDLEEDEIEYLAAHSELPKEKIKMFSSAVKLAKLWEVPTEAVFAVLGSDNPNTQKALENAIEKDVVAYDLLRKNPEIVEKINAGKIELLTQIDFGKGTWDDFFSTQVKDKEKRKAIIAAGLDTPTESDYRKKLAEDGLWTPELEFLLDLESILGIDVATAQSLKSYFQRNTPNGEDLALLENEEWKKILGINDNSDQVVYDTMKKARSLFPNKLFRREVDRYAKTGSSWAAKVASFLEKNPSTKIEDDLPAFNKDYNQGDKDEWQAYANVKGMVALTEDVVAAPKIIDVGFSNARKITGIGEIEFVNRVFEFFPGITREQQKEQAKTVYKKAGNKSAALNAAISFLPIGKKPSLCSCSHCKSVFGPAAYLFDLLYLMQRTSSEESSENGLLHFIDQQRPDLKRINLDCPNTTVEVPQIDLINEILEDEIMHLSGNSLVHNLEEGQCLPPSRQSQGSSELRRAIPQNEPTKQTIELLSETQYPWTLPYDYFRDKAKSAAKQLISKPELHLLLLWRYEVDSRIERVEEATQNLAINTLGLNQNQINLIELSTATGDVWGTRIVEELTLEGPKLASIKETAGIDYETLGELLSSRFITKDLENRFSVIPEDYCEFSEEPRISGSIVVLETLLSRIHQFERLRKYLDWEVQDLDEALSWLEGGIKVWPFGIFLFLQRFWKKSPKEIITLFINPSTEVNWSALPIEQTSAFERRFGKGSSGFPTPDPSLDRSEQVEYLTSRIASVSKTPLSTIDFIFERNLVPDLQSVEEIFTLPTFEEQEQSYRFAVVTAYRLSVWMSCLRVNEKEVLDLMEIAEVSLLPLESRSSDILYAGIRLADLSDRIKGWPISLAALRYLVTGRYYSDESFEKSASEMGIALAELRHALQTSDTKTKPLPEEKRAALRVAISQLLNEILGNDSPDAAIEIQAGQLASDLEWSVFFEERGLEPDTLFSELADGWPGLRSISDPPLNFSSVLVNENSYDLESYVQNFLNLLPTPPDDMGATELSDLINSLELLVEHSLSNSQDDVQNSINQMVGVLSGFWSSRTAPDSNQLENYVEELLEQGVRYLEEILQVYLTNRASEVLVLVQNVQRRLKAKKVVRDWIENTFEISSINAEAFLMHLENPFDLSQSVISAFIDEVGSLSSQLDKSQITARYLEPINGTILLERMESTLVFEWGERGPLESLRGKYFISEYEVPVLANLFLNDDGDPIKMIVESDGACQVSIIDGSNPPEVIFDLTQPSTIVRHEAIAGNYANAEVTLRIRFEVPANGDRVFRLLQEEESGKTQEFKWPVLAPLLTRLNNLSIGFQELKLPQGVFTSLNDPASNRLLDINMISKTASLNVWKPYFALDTLTRRVFNVNTLSKLVSLLAGGEHTHEDWMEVFNLEKREILPFLQVLGIIDHRTSPSILPPEIGLERIVHLLNLIDEAAIYKLPPLVFLEWNQANPEQIFEWVTAALQHGLDENEWLSVLAEIYDPVRENLRNAQLDYLVGQKNRISSGSGKLYSRENIADEKLTDVQMTSCMVTSRIQFAYATIQRYVMLAKSGRMPWIEAGSLEEEKFAREWKSMRQYRLWEAQQRIKYHTAFYYEPHFRLSATPLFKKFQETCLAGPFSLKRLDQAYREYLEGLTEVANLEIIATVTHEPAVRDLPLAFQDSELYGTHVFGRTRANPKRIYYRRIKPAPDSRCTPWELVDVDFEGSHFIAVVVFGRLRLICATFSLANSERFGGKNCNEPRTERRDDYIVAGEVAINDFEVTFTYIDREYGEWSQFKRSDRFPFKLKLEDPPSVDGLFEKSFPFEKIKDYETDEIEVDSILIFIRFLNDGMEDGSRLRVILLRQNSNFRSDRIAISNIIENRNGREAFWVQTEFSFVDGDIAPSDIIGIRLEWEEGHKINDDYEFHSITVEYFGNNELIKTIPIQTFFEGDLAENRVDTMNPQKRVYKGMMRGGHQEGLGEEKIQRVKEAYFEQIPVNNHSPNPSYFKSEYQLKPESIDFGKSLAIRADTSEDESFNIGVYSVESEQVTRISSRFKLKDSSQTPPNAEENWGEDWILGKEICHAHKTKKASVKTLKFYADDIIEESSTGFVIGSHEGVKALGQKLISEVFWEYPITREMPAIIVRSIYADRLRLLSYTVNPSMERGVPDYNRGKNYDFQLTISRNNSLSSGISPKFITFEHYDSENEPGRTLLLEKGEVAYKVYRPQPGHYLQFGERFNGDLSNLLNQYPRVTREYHNWKFSTFWHPQAFGFRRILNSRGIPRLLRTENQELSEGTDLIKERNRINYFNQFINSTGSIFLPIDERYPKDNVDFTITGAYSEYNWELFFDNLLYGLILCGENNLFEEGEEIIALMVDHNRLVESGVWNNPDFHKIAPIRNGLRIEQILEYFDIPNLMRVEGYRKEFNAQLERIRLNAFQPDIILRGYPPIAAKVLRFNIAKHYNMAGEYYFRRAYSGDNRSELEIALSYFDTAARIAGPIEDQIGSYEENQVCYAALTAARSEETEMDELEFYISDELLDLEGESEYYNPILAHFCMPPATEFDSLRAIIARNLLNARSCKDIEGISQSLSIYGRRIDPKLLARATAEGLDLDVLLGRIASPKPTQYFAALWQRALEACERLNSLDDRYINSQQSADSEGFSILQQELEIQALEDQLEILNLRLDDSRKLPEALDITIKSEEQAFEFYNSRERENPQELSEGEYIELAGREQIKAARSAKLSAIMKLFPNLNIYGDAGFKFPPGEGFYTIGARSDYSFGGEMESLIQNVNAESARYQSTVFQLVSSLLGRQGGISRRMEDYLQQAIQARYRLRKSIIDKAGAEIRVTIAELEVDLHKRKIEDSKNLLRFMKNKPTSAKFHQWRANSFFNLRYSQYRIAYELVNQAKAALIFEHGLDELVMVPDTWDPKHQGVNAAAGLIHELEKIQELKRETWRREQEKLKSISLALEHPLALLELVQRGETIVQFTEADFDKDGAGYFRRLMQISIDIPAIKGPYTSINARIIQLHGEKRMKAYSPIDDQYYRSGPEDPRFKDDLASGDFIETNTANQDNGKLDNRSDGENPPPFHMKGAIGTFKIQLDPEFNHFNRSSISDIIINVAYTYRASSDAGLSAAKEARKVHFSEVPRPVMIPLHSTYSGEWHRFITSLQGTGTGVLPIHMSEDLIPLELKPYDRIVQTHIYFSISDLSSLVFPDGYSGSELGAFDNPPHLQPKVNPREDPHFTLPIMRLKLRQPLQPTEQRSITLQLSSRDSEPPRRAWLVCWLKGL